MGSGSSGGGLRNLPGGQLLVKGQPCKGSGSGALEDHSHGQRLGAGPQEEAHAPQVSVFTSHKPNQQTAKSNRFCPLTLTTHLPKDNYPRKAGFVFGSLGPKQEVAASERRACRGFPLGRSFILFRERFCVLRCGHSSPCA